MTGFPVGFKTGFVISLWTCPALFAVLLDTSIIASAISMSISPIGVFPAGDWVDSVKLGIKANYRKSFFLDGSGYGALKLAVAIARSQCRFNCPIDISRESHSDRSAIAIDANVNRFCRFVVTQLSRSARYRALLQLYHSDRLCPYASPSQGRALGIGHRASGKNFLHPLHPLPIRCQHTLPTSALLFLRLKHRWDIIGLIPFLYEDAINPFGLSLSKPR